MTGTATVHSRLHTPRLKRGAFALEAINSLGTTYFFYFAYWLGEKKFGFKSIENLKLAAALGFAYVFAAIIGGRFAQRHGYLFSVRIGACAMAITFLIGAFVDAWWPTFAIIMIANFAMCFTWPALEAMVSEGEPRHRMQSMVGIYNVTWAGAGAFAYFTGGAMIQHWGIRSMYLVPVGLFVIEFFLAFALEKELRNSGPDTSSHESDDTIAEKHANAPAFLKMAWVANPFAYLGCNTVIAIIPTLAHNMNLTATMAGIICSTWLFVRAGSFILLRNWPNWHYRFDLLILAYISMIVAFAVILLIPNLFILVVAQIIFGLAHGLIYYSSLFYSMDVGETKGEHSGIHEAAIGAGNGGGPAIAALALWLWPNHPSSGAWSVVLLLLVGLAVIFWLKPRHA